MRGANFYIVENKSATCLNNAMACAASPRYLPCHRSGYVPSSSAADDYLDELKKDSKKRNKLFRSSMEDDSVPQEPDYPNIPEVEQQQPQSQVR